MSESIHLFERFGIELEYMIVDKDNLKVKPISDEIIKSVTGEYKSDAEFGDIEISNEIVLHVIELKTNGPALSLNNLDDSFHRVVKELNKLLESHNAILLPSAVHPTMDPLKETKIWPHHNSAVYEAYDKIFNCKGHGWSNLQSTHINLPYKGDEEFGNLHAAIRAVLPILPALAASSPIIDGKFSGSRDVRLEFYRKNQSRIPSITGSIIPERVFTREDYKEEILEWIYSNIEKFDTDKLLRHEWLNSRGAIARFQRKTIEIRTLDIQESPKVDISIAAFVTELLKKFINEEWRPLDELKAADEDELARILFNVIKVAESSIITNKNYLGLFGLEGSQKISAKDLLQYIFEELKDFSKTPHAEVIQAIIKNGTLSSRIIRAVKNDFSPKNLNAVYFELADCLAKNEMFRV
ncbi:MAG: hypothetical protein K9J12_04555 [Melioribacteraceae bacterium]|nr:hypothetical protein [Melioribacteraceae bacterium]MCF8263538.1 hypothetical protein [Melioribacteraceae bacterium]MCF8413516.1 hypothetical protein [Melioribacteraceae bacterium]MCF8430664.1 hypothetical protein [Melioribacteraceae bacterium]